MTDEANVQPAFVLLASAFPQEVRLGKYHSAQNRNSIAHAELWSLFNRPVGKWFWDHGRQCAAAGAAVIADQRDKLNIGEIPVDAIFSPVRKVNFTVKPERIGQMTNLDRVELEVWTDGTIRPLEAVTEASGILAKHFIIISRLKEEDLVPLERPAVAAIEGDGRDMPIEELNLSVRAYNCLKRAGITKVGEVLDRLAKGEEEIMSIRN